MNRPPPKSPLFPSPPLSGPAGGRGNGFDRFEREPAGEDRQPPKQGLFVRRQEIVAPGDGIPHGLLPGREVAGAVDRKSTRLNSSHANISYAVFCLKNKNLQS